MAAPPAQAARPAPPIAAALPEPAAAPRFDKPLGPVLEAFGTLGLSWLSDPIYLIDLDDPLGSDARRVEQCRAEYGLELLGKCFMDTFYFGVPRTWDASAIEDHPVVLVDKVGGDPEVFAANLREFLGLVAYSPLYRVAANEADSAERRRQSLDSEDAVALAGKIAQLPGVELPRTPWQRTLPMVALRMSRPSPETGLTVG